jgi:hypothetical protein
MQKIDPRPYAGITFNFRSDLYFQLDALSSGLLRSIAQSPLHGKNYLDSAEEREVTEDMILGTLIHQYVLEPEKPLPRLAVKPADMKFNTTEGKQWRTKMLGEEKLIITEDSYTAIYGAARSISRHPTAKLFMDVGDSEVGVVWQDEKTGLWCKALIDWLPPGDCLVDLKSSADITPGLFDSKAWQKYRLQCCWYRRGWNAMCKEGDEKAQFYFIAVENKAPYDAVVYDADEFLLTAEAELDKLLATWKDCVTTNIYPGQCSGIAKLHVPGYVLRKMEGL